MSFRTIIKFKDGKQSCIEADFICHREGVIEIWKGENSLVGVFNLSDIVGVLLTK